MMAEYTFEDTIPVAPLKIAALESCRELAEKVNEHIITFRRHDAEALKKKQKSIEFRGYDADTYLMNLKCSRFGSGEAKGMLMESVRGADVFVMADVTNYSLTYSLCGQINHMSPDDHYQDMKRIIATSMASSHRVNVIMPYLYEGRQHKRNRRESLDCATALEELTNMGVANIITFDAHDPRVQNAIPLHGFDNFTAPYQFMQTLLSNDRSLKIDKEHLMVISPDEGAMNRSVYFANNLGVDMGMFYKRRDYSTVINGRNPIVAHEFLGSDVSGKTVIIVDDMIASGESMLDTARELKERKAEKVIVCCTFGLFTEGYEKFDLYYEKGYIDYIITTNLNYHEPELEKKPWYLEADMSKYLAVIINTLNHDTSIGDVLNPTERIQSLVKRYCQGLPSD
ncbi:ribose-phosphate pyrophosphokinase [Cuneatibacter caecimuris]|nr:ribose-phosphate pyrophosphokinase [Cuneatibacter caecimuris]